MKTLKTFAIALFAVVALGACTVEQTEEAKLPDVNVEVEGGNLPEYDVDTAEIEVGLETKEVKVPDVDVELTSETMEVEVPDVDIDMPDDELVDDAPDDDNYDS